MSLPSVFIILVNWNNWRDTLKCLESLARINYDKARLIVVDNGSENDSCERLSEWGRNRPDFMLLQTGDNLGFAGGCNVGIRAALAEKADYLLLLNNDTVVTPDFLSPLVETAMACPEAGIVGGTIYKGTGESVWFREGKISWPRGGGRHTGKLRGRRSAPFETGFVTGCLMLIRASVCEKIGLLEESYFLYNEDADYCLRADRAGFKIMVSPKSVIYHKENSTHGGWKAYHIYYLIRNKLIFMRRHAPDAGVRWAFYGIVFTLGAGLFLFWTLKGRFDLIGAYLQALADYCRKMEGKKRSRRC